MLKLKKWGITALIALFALSVLFFVLPITSVKSQNTAKAEVVVSETPPTIGDITLLQGASVRLTQEYNGIRFQVEVDDSFKSYIYCDDNKSAVYHIGVVMHDTELLAGNELTIETDGAERAELVRWSTSGAKQGKSLLNVVIYDIPTEKFASDITARAYLRNSQTNTVWYTDASKNVTRNVAEIASKMLNKGESNAEKLAILNEYVDGAVTTKGVTSNDVTYTTTSGTSISGDVSTLSTDGQTATFVLPQELVSVDMIPQITVGNDKVNASLSEDNTKVILTGVNMSRTTIPVTVNYGTTLSKTLNVYVAGTQTSDNTFKYQASATPTADVTYNFRTGNLDLKSITVGGAALANTNYTYSATDSGSTLTIKGSYISALKSHGIKDVVATFGLGQITKTLNLGFGSISRDGTATVVATDMRAYKYDSAEPVATNATVAKQSDGTVLVTTSNNNGNNVRFDGLTAGYAYTLKLKFYMAGTISDFYITRNNAIVGRIINGVNQVTGSYDFKNSLVNNGGGWYTWTVYAPASNDTAFSISNINGTSNPFKISSVEMYRSNYNLQGVTGSSAKTYTMTDVSAGSATSTSRAVNKASYTTSKNLGDRVVIDNITESGRFNAISVTNASGNGDLNSYFYLSNNSLVMRSSLINSYKGSYITVNIARRNTAQDITLDGASVWSSVVTHTIHVQQRDYSKLSSFYTSYYGKDSPTELNVAAGSNGSLAYNLDTYYAHQITMVFKPLSGSVNELFWYINNVENSAGLWGSGITTSGSNIVVARSDYASRSSVVSMGDGWYVWNTELPAPNHGVSTTKKVSLRSLGAAFSIQIAAINICRIDNTNSYNNLSTSSGATITAANNPDYLGNAWVRVNTSSGGHNMLRLHVTINTLGAGNAGITNETNGSSNNRDVISGYPNCATNHANRKNLFGFRHNNTWGYFYNDGNNGVVTAVRRIWGWADAVTGVSVAPATVQNGVYIYEHSGINFKGGTGNSGTDVVSDALFTTWNAGVSYFIDFYLPNISGNLEIYLGASATIHSYSYYSLGTDKSSLSYVWNAKKYMELTGNSLTYGRGGTDFCFASYGGVANYRKAHLYQGRTATSYGTIGFTFKINTLGGPYVEEFFTTDSSKYNYEYTFGYRHADGVNWAYFDNWYYLNTNRNKSYMWTINTSLEYGKSATSSGFGVSGTQYHLSGPEIACPVISTGTTYELTISTSYIENGGLINLGENFTITKIKYYWY